MTENKPLASYNAQESWVPWEGAIAIKIGGEIVAWTLSGGDEDHHASDIVRALNAPAAREMTPAAQDTARRIAWDAINYALDDMAVLFDENGTHYDRPYKEMVTRIATDVVEALFGDERE